ncbi:alpha/beta hydrolase [Lachnoclostridium edouardi]|uniref:alpha/beta hydrolase n=1 Tax=Lachnoclostridium edouardi TaxID=1926283 RepID=UPI0015E0647C|nr:alpha/beta hydrolase [Lachnoclostridium edouardi]
MSEKIWKEISLTAEEQKLVDEIRLGGAGRSLPQEMLNQYHVGKEWDMEIETRVGKTLVHMYWPEGGEEKKLPLFINFHGGGFLKGRRDQDIVFCRNICSKAGVALADVDYIPAPAMRYPGQLYAGFDVLQYMAEHGEEWNINVDKIAVGGHSAGGSLTAGLVLKAIQEKKFVPALQSIDYAPVDMSEPTLSKRNCDSNPKIPVWKMEFYNKMYMEPEDMKDIFASPLLAPDELLSKEPPTVVMYCDSDVFCDEDAAFADRLMKLGVPVYAKRFMNSAHGFLIQRRDEYETGEKMLVQALRSLLL